MMNRLFALLSLLVSCEFSDSLGQVKIPAADYSGCCGVQPVEFSMEKQRVYVPNVFTPNGDGVNDYFMPYINEEVGAVWGLTIYTAKGDTIIYQRAYFDYKKKFEDYAWNGLRQDRSQYSGLFRYKMRIDDKLGNPSIIEGYACAVLCGSGSKILRSKEGCFYPVQAKNGLIDKSIANQEKDCL